MDEISKYWRVYQGALMPKTAPHLPPRSEQLSRWYLLKNGILFARWEDNFDCGYETEWYHVIKDDKLDITKLNSNRRYKITKGRKNFYTKVIDPKEYAESIFRVAQEAYKTYPLKYRPRIKKGDFIANIKERTNIFIGCFDIKTDVLCGYADINCYQDYINYTTHKVIPAEEKRQVNAALVCGVLEYFEQNNKYKYIDDGARNIVHETGFQDYLKIYFGFRKAYSHLHVMYNPLIWCFVYCLYPIRQIIKKFDKISLFAKVSSVLEQERIRRSFK